MKRLRVYALVLLIATTTTSCIIPDFKKTVIAGKRIEPADRAFIQPGVTALSNVVERLGPPTATFDDLDVIAYEWTHRLYETILPPYVWDVETSDKVFFVAADKMQKVHRADVRSRSYRKPLHTQAARWVAGPAAANQKKAPHLFSPVPVPPGKAVLYVYYLHYYWSPELRVGKELLTQVRADSYNFGFLPAGSHLVHIKLSPPGYTKFDKEVSLEVLPDRAYYLRLRWTRGGIWTGTPDAELKAELVSESEALPEIRALKLTE